jgi:glutathione-regulated potassium-efflux system ancillary protein KefC
MKLICVTVGQMQAEATAFKAKSWGLPILDLPALEIHASKPSSSKIVGALILNARIRASLLLAGTIISVLWSAASLYFSKVHYQDLYALAVVSSVIVSALLYAEALGVASPVIEVIFGLIAGWLGVHVTSTLDSLAVMGSSAIMFLVGLEIDTEFIRKNFIDSIRIGLAGFLVPMTISALALGLAGYSMRTSLLVAVALSTTSVAVVYAIIKLLRVERSHLGQAALASAMIADVASIIAFSALLVQGSLWLILYFASLVLVPVLLMWLLRGLPKLGYEAEVRIIIALLLAATLISEAVGVHTVLASFILGLSLQEFAKEPPIRDKIEAIVTGFLAPVFFVVAGIYSSLADPRKAVILALAFLALSYPPKIASTHLAFKKVLGTAPREVVASFGARLTVSTLIAYAGLKMGSLDPNVAGAIMLSAVIATLTSGILSREREPLPEA